MQATRRNPLLYQDEDENPFPSQDEGAPEDFGSSGDSQRRG